MQFVEVTGNDSSIKTRSQPITLTGWLYSANTAGEQAYATLLLGYDR